MQCINEAEPVVCFLGFEPSLWGKLLGDDEELPPSLEVRLPSGIIACVHLRAWIWQMVWDGDDDRYSLTVCQNTMPETVSGDEDDRQLNILVFGSCSMSSLSSRR